MRGLVFDLQHYAVHDGPGIRTLVFLKGCPLRCVWCCNPESQAAAPELRHHRARCRACLACAAACPAGAITAIAGRPVIDRTPCRTCVDRACVAACPESALAVVGEERTVEDVIARVAADLPFYRNSGGGMTVSGGEPFAQPEFLAALLAGARARGIHTAVETCGQAATADLLAVAPLVDLFLYDLKLVDAERHRAVTGVGSEQILANLRRLVERAPGRVIVRLPLVPGLTDGAADLEAAAARLRELGLDRVHLQPYHPLGNDKYGDLGRAAPFASNERPDVERAAAILARCGLVGTPP